MSVVFLWKSGKLTNQGDISQFNVTIKMILFPFLNQEFVVFGKYVNSLGIYGLIREMG